MDIKTLSEILDGYFERAVSREEMNSQLLPYLEDLYREAKKRDKLTSNGLDDVLRYLQGTAFESLCLLAFIPHAVSAAYPKAPLEVQEVVDKSNVLWEQMQSAL